MDLKSIIIKLHLIPLHPGPDLNTEVTGAIFSDILSDVMARARKGELWITNQTHVNIIALVFFKGLAGVILPGGIKPEPDAVEKAEQKNIPVFTTPNNAFEVAGQLYQVGLR
ncbi:MAG TPA: DRTGG domain-containing protein [bacterium]|nr:DRTGG domain-containing protein [bacterium]HPN46050.1 DRTGG domain-containing protein [bacterium]